MALRWFVRPNAYYDSVKLMRVSEALAHEPGVVRAAAVMATPLNLDLLAEDGLLAPDARSTPDDLLVTVLANSERDAETALARIDHLLAVRAPTEETSVASVPRSLDQLTGQAELAVIAVPGTHATGEAYAALRAGMHVFLFSDNVSLEDEIALKRLAAERNLLLMGPDCGTAILGGTGLGFANRVDRGPVGIVGASGTGIQHLCSLLDADGIGIAEAIGTGGRDLSARVGGSMTRRAVQMLDDDPEVSVLLVVSKPSSHNVSRQLDRLLRRLATPAVVCLLGRQLPDSEHVHYGDTLEDAARIVSSLVGGSAIPVGPENPAPLEKSAGLRVYGLFAGGTLCSEATQILDAAHAPHQMVDLGDDQYTRGRAHPIIDPRLRVSLLGDLARHDDLGVVLLDVILGDLAHPDPVVSLIPAIERLRTQCGRPALPVVACLVGTRRDPQNLQHQRARLEAAGITVRASNAAAARLAAAAVGAAP